MSKTHEIGRAAKLIDLAMELQARTEGMTIDQIADFVDGSRRTAERYRDALHGLFPDLTSETRDDGRKAWKLQPNRFLSRMAPAADELAQLKSAARSYEERGQQLEADLLDSLYRKIAAAAVPTTWSRLDPDIEALLEAEGLATSQGPRKRVDAKIVSTLREAILHRKRVILHYTRRDSGRPSKPLICPYGFLLGRRQYLVAFGLHPDVKEVRIYVLANIRQVDVQEKGFETDPDFDLKTFADRSFGSWFDDNPVDAVWRFSPQVAEDAREHLFHPTQTMEEQDDGSVIARFRACGTLEMCWHLFTWGDQVEILSPPGLKTQYEELLEQALNALTGAEA